MSSEQKDGVGAVKAWMRKHQYSTAGGDNIGFLLLELVTQVQEKTLADAMLAARKEPRDE